MTNIKGASWSKATPELCARIAALAPELWAQHPEIALAFAFGPPDQVLPYGGLGLVSVNGELAPELLDAPSFPAELESLYTAALAISDERRDKLKRLKHALLLKDTALSLEIAAELCGVSYEKEGNRTHPRIH